MQYEFNEVHAGKLAVLLDRGQHPIERLNASSLLLPDFNLPPTVYLALNEVAVEDGPSYVQWVEGHAKLRSTMISSLIWPGEPVSFTSLLEIFVNDGVFDRDAFAALAMRGDLLNAKGAIRSKLECAHPPSLGKVETHLCALGSPFKTGNMREHYRVMQIRLSLAEKVSIIDSHMAAYPKSAQRNPRAPAGFGQ